MIWWNLALFVVSFIATALLAPKPEFEDARAENLEPDQFPRATEDSPIPLLLGCIRMRAPNTLWYGDYETRAITEKVKTGLFSSEKVVVGHKYYLSLDLGLCLGPDVRLKSIFIDEEEVFDGTSEYTDEYEVAGTATTIPTSSTILNYDYIDLLSMTGLTAEQYDTLALAGAIKVKFDYQVRAEKTPLAGGGPSDGSYVLDTDFTVLEDGTSLVFPIEGAAAMSSLATGTTIAMDLSLAEVTAPVGARYLRYAGQLSPTLSLFTNLYVDVQLVTVSVKGQTISEVYSQINEPELFGGRKSGGGWVGDFSFYPGSFLQPVDSDLETSLGSGNVPAYRGTSHIVLANQYIGESPNIRRMDFLLARYINDNYWGPTADGKAATSGGEDISPVQALYTILTDEWSGLGLATSDIEISSFDEVDAVLEAEENGMSVLVTSPKAAKGVIQEILRQIDGVMYQDPSTGKINLKVIRDDYVPGDLSVYDEDDIIAVKSYQKTSWEEVRTQVKVSYSSRVSEGSKVAIAQDMALQGMLGGSFSARTANLSFPFCYDATLAAKLAARELSVLSTPLIKMKLEMNRNGYRLQPGDVFKVSWPEYGITEVIVRVQKVDMGELLDNKCVIEVVQDIFAAAEVVLSAPIDTGWVDGRPYPETLTTEIAEMPRFFGKKLEWPVEDDTAALIPFPLQPKNSSSGFDLLAGPASGELDYYDPSDVLFPISGALSSDLAQSAGLNDGIHEAGVTLTGVVGGSLDALGTPSAATTEEVQSGEAGILYANGEWMAYEGVTDNGGGSWTLDTLYRGLLGTTPVAHSANSQFFILTLELLGHGDLAGLIADDSTIYYKVLDRVGAAVRSSGAETELSYALNEVANRPLRPRNLALGGTRGTSVTQIKPTGAANLTWFSSNREASLIPFETSPTETPDQTEEYDLEVWVDGVQDVSFDASNITSPYSLDLTTASGSLGEIRLYSRRASGDTKSSLYYAWLPFNLSSLEALSGDMNSGNDTLLVSGDQQSGVDGVALSGDEV